jgi:Ran GTPase-activating protein (RanGAP) involved in mRNA processing and transport
MIGRIMKKLKQLTHLNLSKNSLGRLGAEIIGKQLRTCRSIATLDVSCNNMNDAGTIAIVMACQDHPAMRHLYIGANDLTTAVVPSLCVYVQGSTRLETLDISYNFIGRGIIKLLHSVSKSQTLKVLNMSYNAGTESCLGAVKHVLMNSLPTEDDPGLCFDRCGWLGFGWFLVGFWWGFGWVFDLVYDFV